MANNPTLLAMPLAQNGQKNAIPETQATAGDGLFSQSTGFPAETSLPLGAGGVAPSREDFNGMANLLGGVAFYAQKGWQFQFDAGQDYFAGCVVRDTTDGKLYECLNDVAAGGSVPSADSVNWKLYEFAPINSPTFTGTPKAPTAAAGTNTTQIATTAFVKTAVDSAAGANKNLSNLTTTGENHFLSKDFTYIYPNGGTASSPANIAANSRYVESNPFTGYIVVARVEVKVNGVWGELNNIVYGSTAGKANGVIVSTYNDSIVVQTANQYIYGASWSDGNPFASSAAKSFPLPCRVKVWKVGKV